MRVRTRHVILAIAIMAIGCLAYAQDVPAMRGTIYLKGGQSMSGNINSAELGFRDGTGTGVGSELPNSGAIAVNTADAGVVSVPADQIAVIEAKWEQVEQAGRNPWEITELRVTRRDGTEVVGTPDWFMHASSVAVSTEDGQVKRIHAFPLATDFSSDDLLVKIELADAAPSPVTPEPITPVTETPEPTTPVTEPAPTPTETVPTPVEPTTETPVVEVVGPVADPDMQVSEVHVLPSQDVVLTLRCPKCSETITLLLRVSVLQGLATGASGVSITPIEPAEQ